MRSTYVCNVDLGHAPALSGTILTYVFEVNDGASAGSTELDVTVDQICNWQGEQLNIVCSESVAIEVLPPKSDQAFLKSLIPFWKTFANLFTRYILLYIGCPVQSVERHI